MSIKTKFFLVFILITILASTLGFQLLKADQLANQQRERYLLSNRQITLALELKSKLILAIKDVADSIILGEEELEEYRIDKTFINKIIQELAQTTSKEDEFSKSRTKDNREEEVEQTKDIKNKIEILLKNFDNLIEDKIKNNKPISKVLFEKYFEEQLEQSLVLLIEQFIEDERKELEKITQSAENESNKVKRFTYLIWGISFITFLIVFIVFYRSIATPLTQLKQAATKLGEKDHSLDLKLATDNELGAVVQAFQNMEHKIRANFENIESLFKLIVENSNDAIISINFEGKVISWNRGAEKIYGYNHDEIIGKSISIIVPDDLKHEPKSIIENIKKGENDLKIETKRIAKDGRIIDIALNLHPITDSASKCIGISSISRDITEIKKHQETLVEARNEAEVANKAKSEFLSRMSHEFRTPLNSILGFSQILQTENTDPLTESQKEKLKYISNSGIHLLKLINGLLDLTALESGNLPINIQEVSLNKLIDESFNEIKEYAKNKNLRFIDNIPSDKEIWVNADHAQLKKVLHNLLTNAIKYNKENGHVDISVSINTPKTALLKISDTGVGISKDKQEKIFQPFNAINPQISFEEGLGLGLSISKVLIGMMKGKIFFESQVDKGSSFFIELPFVKEQTVSPENMNNKASTIKNFNANMEKEAEQAVDLTKVSIPGKLRMELLETAEIYNYTKLENLINELEEQDENGQIVAKLCRKFLHQYDVEKITDILNKTRQIT